jgi:RNA polymerase sigma factor (sigma-70 family)
MSSMASRREDDERRTSQQRGTLEVSDATLADLVEVHSRAMVGTARRYLTSAYDVEDAVQDAWLAYTLHSASIQQYSAVGAWLRATTAHAALRIVRRQARVSVSGALPEPLVDPSDAVSLEVAQDALAVDLALSRLAQDDRLLIRLLFEDELPYAQVSALTGRAVAGVGPTRQRVVQKLRRDPALRHLERFGPSVAA